MPLSDLRYIPAAPARVLHVVGGMDTGGIETLIMSVYRVIDREQVQFDFLLSTDKEYFYNAEIRSLGGRIFSVPTSRKHPKASSDRLHNFFREHSYDVVHVHKGTLDSLYHLCAAKEAGVPTRIIHSHCAFPQVKDFRGAVNRLIHDRSKGRLPDVATDFFACSIDAARYFAFDRLSGSSGWRQVNNGIDTARFAFDPVKRASTRAELDIAEDEFVVGTVGRLSPPKKSGVLRGGVCRVAQGAS